MGDHPAWRGAYGRANNYQWSACCLMSPQDEVRGVSKGSDAESEGTNSPYFTLLRRHEFRIGLYNFHEQ